MLMDASNHGIFVNHPGRFLLRVLDALHPERDLVSESGLTGKKNHRFRAVFLNYLLDCLPAAVLEVDENEVRQLYVRTCMARGVALQEYTELSIEDLRAFAASRDPNHKRKLLELHELFTSVYDYRSVDVRSLPYGELVPRAYPGGGKVVHNYGAIQCLDGILSLLHEQGFILVNDYGSAQGRYFQEFEHQRYAGSTFVGVNFAMLKSYFSGSGRCQWIEPPEDSQHIYSRLLGRGVGPETAKRFKGISQRRLSTTWKSRGNWREMRPDKADMKPRPLPTEKRLNGNHTIGC
jgi:hypothetical protein